MVNSTGNKDRKIVQQLGAIYRIKKALAVWLGLQSAPPEPFKPIDLAREQGTRFWLK